MTMTTELGRVVTYLEGLPPLKSHGPLSTWLTNWNPYISTTTEPMASKRGRMVTYLEPISPIKLLNPFITWSCKITWQTKTSISPLLQCLCQPNLAGWWHTFRVSYRYSRVAFNQVILPDHVATAFGICLCSRQMLRLLPRHIYVFSTYLGKTEAIEFLGIIKKYFSKNRKTIGSKKINVLLNKKIILVFHMIFKVDCITQIIYFIIHICLYSLFILLLLSYISLQETGHRKNTNPSLLIQVAKNQQSDRKKNLGVSECVCWICNWWN